LGLGESFGALCFSGTIDALVLSGLVFFNPLLIHVTINTDHSNNINAQYKYGRCYLSILNAQYKSRDAIYPF
jgi:hypothetical protein